MKVLVPIKRVLDSNLTPRVKSDGSGVELAGLKMAINPFCEIAVEEAVRLKEAGQAEEVVVVCIGPAVAQDVLRNALAMGADRALLIVADQAPESLAVAKLLRQVVDGERPDLVILGKQSIDLEGNQTGQMLAALLGWAQATFISKLEIGTGAVVATREVDSGLQVVELPLPAVITTDLRLNEPRYASLPNIMKAKKKPLEERQASAMGVDMTPRLRVLKTEAPRTRRAGLRVTSATELVDKLKNEAAVL